MVYPTWTRLGNVIAEQMPIHSAAAIRVMAGRADAADAAVADDAGITALLEELRRSRGLSLSLAPSRLDMFADRARAILAD